MGDWKETEAFSPKTYYDKQGADQDPDEIIDPGEEPPRHATFKFFLVVGFVLATALSLSFCTAFNSPTQAKQIEAGDTCITVDEAKSAVADWDPKAIHTKYEGDVGQQMAQYGNAQRAKQGLPRIEPTVAVWESEVHRGGDQFFILGLQDLEGCLHPGGGAIHYLIWQEWLNKNIKK